MLKPNSPLRKKRTNCKKEEEEEEHEEKRRLILMLPLTKVNEDPKRKWIKRRGIRHKKKQKQKIRQPFWSYKIIKAYNKNHCVSNCRKMAGLARIRRELSEFRENELEESGVDVTVIGDSLNHMRGTLRGSIGTPYEGGVFTVDIQVYKINTKEEERKKKSFN